MASVEKISVTIPTDLLWAVKGEMKTTGRNRSQVITACVRAKLAPETTGLYEATGAQNTVVGADLADLEERLGELVARVGSLEDFRTEALRRAG